ncbi:hypothetical protein DL764_009470 [Monosporascus ibericus]|uniref:Heterokaryon incompatibility domain-containing protein n=1 Tax=Monosporascus ibericus TaxID=155417 RepID=A0A4Q4SXP1_9PEZI|nr:hypothetical protein DL764_009470 [Monosporascus ibericus]
MRHVLTDKSISNICSVFASSEHTGYTAESGLPQKTASRIATGEVSYYFYKQLVGRRQIRLVTICGGKPSDPIKFRLKCVTLSTSLSYEALSYEWKGSNGKTEIICGNTTLEVTCNLATGLRALRFADRPRILWADAICINQGNNDEKSKQIPLMRDIYAIARSVVIWLGPEFRGVAVAFQILPYLALLGMGRFQTGNPDDETIENMTATIIIERPKYGSIIPSVEDLESRAYYRDYIMLRSIERHPGLDDDTIFRFNDEEAWEAIDKLFCDSYFQRSWIMQEVAVAKEV